MKCYYIPGVYMGYLMGKVSEVQLDGIYTSCFDKPTAPTYKVSLVNVLTQETTKEIEISFAFLGIPGKPYQGDDVFVVPCQESVFLQGHPGTGNIKTLNGMPIDVFDLCYVFKNPEASNRYMIYNTLDQELVFENVNARQFYRETLTDFYGVLPKILAYDYLQDMLTYTRGVVSTAILLPNDFEFVSTFTYGIYETPVIHNQSSEDIEIGFQNKLDSLYAEDTSVDIYMSAVHYDTLFKPAMDKIDWYYDINVINVLALNKDILTSVLGDVSNSKSVYKITLHKS